LAVPLLGYRCLAGPVSTIPGISRGSGIYSMIIDHPHQLLAAVKVAVNHPGVVTIQLDVGLAVVTAGVNEIPVITSGV
jgi:hypothetical protein